jgi:hypothetical protein
MYLHMMLICVHISVDLCFVSLFHVFKSSFGSLNSIIFPSFCQLGFQCWCAYRIFKSTCLYVWMIVSLLGILSFFYIYAFSHWHGQFQSHIFIFPLDIRSLKCSYLEGVPFVASFTRLSYIFHTNEIMITLLYFETRTFILVGLNLNGFL